MIRKVDILVAGGGPAGCAAASAAAEIGAEVLLVESKRRLGERPHCAEWTPRLLVREVDFPERCIVQTTDNMISIGPGFEKITPAPGFVLDRGRFDHGLGEKAALAGAEIRSGTRLAGWDHGIATLKGPWGTEKIKAAVLIAADGASSLVRRLTGLRPARRLTGIQEEVVLTTSLKDTRIYFDPAWRFGYAWLFPKGPVANLGLGMMESRPGEAREALEAFKKEMLAQGLIRRGCLGRSVGAIAVDGPGRTLVHDSVILAGDAAGLTHPITGAGIPQAVVSGRDAGRAAATRLDGGGEQSMAKYNENTLDLYGHSLTWARERRRLLETGWDNRPFRELIKQTWPAFREYREKNRGRAQRD